MCTDIPKHRDYIGNIKGVEMEYLTPCFLKTEEYKEVELIYENNKGNIKKKGYNNHHKIPVCYFDAMGIDVDNSESNLVYLDKKTHKKVHILLAECVNPELIIIPCETEEGEKTDAYNLIKHNMLVAGGALDNKVIELQYEMYKKKSDRCTKTLMEAFNPDFDFGLESPNGRQPIYKKANELENEKVFWGGLFPPGDRAMPIEAWKAVYGDSIKFDF